MTTKAKICPLMSRPVVTDGLDIDMSKVECLGPQCQFWEFAYTTEGIRIMNCVVVIGNLKNADGFIPV